MKMCVQNWTNLGAHKPFFSLPQKRCSYYPNTSSYVLDFCAPQNTSKAEHTCTRGKAAHTFLHT